MRRDALRWLAIFWPVGFGCGLLLPYPGNGDPADALSGLTSDDPADVDPERLEGGDPDRTAPDPLVDPAVDDSIQVVSNNDPTVAFPGEAFTIDLNFTASQSNVVGGGIQFPNSPIIQWTFIRGVEDQNSGTIQFGYVVAADACDDIPNLCHSITTTQFAVADNVGAEDFDGDGDIDDFVVSPGVEVQVVLQCATCDSESCREELPEGACRACAQPEVCVDYFDRCLAEGMPNAESDEANLFETILGPDGVLWTSKEGCAAGENTCDQAQVRADLAPGECGL